MSGGFDFENALVPVTALEFLNLGRLYLIAGEGQDIKVYDHRSGCLLSRHRIFNSESIHGITCCVHQQVGQKANARLLLWGGKSMCLVELASRDYMPAAALSFNIAVTEVRTDDWILDVCFNPFASEAAEYTSAPFEAVTATAHNRLRRLRFPCRESLKIQDSVAFESSALHETNSLGSRPNALLYSAHISWSRKDHADARILVATGSVLGEVYLWSSEYRLDGELGILRLLYTFTGHFGSVFGVRLGEEVESMVGCATRLLASCSDDRTIRIWNVSDLKISSQAVESKQCLASVMGHASRIWAVRFLYGLKTTLQLLSLGEDGTAQMWLLKPASVRQLSRKNSSRDPLGLVHNSEYKYHCGKHIWAVAVLEKGNGSSLIATGGADGRIVSYHRDMPYLKAPERALAYHSTVSQLTESQQGAVTCAENTSRKRTIFQAMQGQWRLSRSIRSALPTYPSGTLNGVAKVQRRPATDPAFDEECLYSEEGDFVTHTGLTMKATRQYVYRYQQRIDELTTWFVQTEGRGLVDQLFHRLNFTHEREERHAGKPNISKTIWIAKGHHLCLNDRYAADYEFIFLGHRLEEWGVKFTVQGPQKNYVADATYSRYPLANAWTQIGANPDYIASIDRAVQLATTKDDAFKNYAWISKSDFLTTTEQGNVLVGAPNAHRSADGGDVSVSALTWDNIGQTTDLKSSCIVTSIPSLGAAFLIGSNGSVFRYLPHTKTLKLAVTLQQKPAFSKAQEVSSRMTEHEDDNCGEWGKVFDFLHASKSLSWISLVTTSLTSDQAVVSLHTSDGQEISCVDQQFLIGLPKGFIVTSSCLLAKETLVILGSRKGDLFIYDPLRTCCSVVPSPLESVFAGIHGQEAITDIQVVPERHTKSNPKASWIVTTGRDGRVAIHQITFTDVARGYRKPSLKTYHELNLPFGPKIEGAHFDSTSQELCIWGFDSTQFVVWNETTKTRVMSIDCGGAHRHWAYTPLDNGKGGGNFVWTKASTCNVYEQTEASHRVLEVGGHGREIKAIALASDHEQGDGAVRPVIATGAEDTAIRLFEYEPASGYRCVSIITKHTTGIQKLRWSGTHSQYLFSAAGCEEFFIWQISRVPILGIGSICRLICPPVTPDKDLRIMDFTIRAIQGSAPTAVEGDSSVQLVAMVYSDSSVRIFAFHCVHSRKHSLTLLLESFYTTQCLTQVVLIDLSSEIYLCTASTDGYLAFWPLKNVLEGHGFYQREDSSTYFDPEKHSEDPPRTFPWQKRFRVHLSSIKGLVHVPLGLKDSLIVTCGDDQALAITHIAAQAAVPNKQGLTQAVLLLPEAHASAVTALTYLGSEAEILQTRHNFASVGNDQQLKIWEVIDSLQGEGMERFKIRMKAQVHTSVADASSLSAFAARENEPIRVCVAGIGMETWSVKGGMLLSHKE